MDHKPTEEHKIKLIDFVIENDGYDLGYIEFTVCVCEITENITGIELQSQFENDELVEELWCIYETKRNIHFSHSSRMFLDM